MNTLSKKNEARSFCAISIAFIDCSSKGCSQSCCKNYCSHTENSPEDTLTTQPGYKSVKKEEVKWMMVKDEEDLKVMVLKCLKEIKEDSGYEKNGDKKDKKSEKKMIVEVGKEKKDEEKDKKNRKNRKDERMREDRKKTIKEDEMETKNTENDTKKEAEWKRSKKDDGGDSKHKEKGNDKKKQESVAPEDVPTQSDKKTKKSKNGYKPEDMKRESIKVGTVKKRAKASRNKKYGEIEHVRSFVLKQTFDDLEEETSTGATHNHFGIDWNLCIHRIADNLFVWLECPNLEENGVCKVGGFVKLTSGDNTIVENIPFIVGVYKDDSELHKFVGDYVLKRHCINGKLHLECHVEVDYIDKFKPFLRDFGEKSKKFSDVILDVDGKKFYVSKLSLASHCAYFEALFLGNPDKSKSEFKLDEKNQHDFQYFLEVLHGESSVDDDSVERILRLAEKYGSKTAFRRCEEFLMKESKASKKWKFLWAIGFKLMKLMDYIVSEMKSAKEMRSILLSDWAKSELSKMDSDLLAKLLLKSLSFSKKSNKWKKKQKLELP